MNRFTESEVEEAALEYVQYLGYSVVSGPASASGLLNVDSL